MAPKLTEDEIDDLLYFARTGELDDFQVTVTELKTRESTGLVDLLQVAKDEHSGNGPLHMASANGHTGMLHNFHPLCFIRHGPCVRNCANNQSQLSLNPLSRNSTNQPHKTHRCSLS